MTGVIHGMKCFRISVAAVWKGIMERVEFELCLTDGCDVTMPKPVEYSYSKNSGKKCSDWGETCKRDVQQTDQLD